jgi:hypothetical protein
MKKLSQEELDRVEKLVDEICKTIFAGGKDCDPIETLAALSQVAGTIILSAPTAQRRGNVLDSFVRGVAGIAGFDLTVSDDHPPDMDGNAPTTTEMQ